MANNENLEMYKFVKSASKARECGEKGGVESGKSKRKKREMREWLELALELPSKDDASKTKLEVSMLKVAEGMEDGDLRALDRAINILNNGLNINHNYGGREMTQEEAAAYIREIMEKM